MATLKDWYLVKSNHYHLEGHVNGHPRLPDNCHITTTAVQSIELRGDHLFAKTKSGTLYEMELSGIKKINDYILKNTIAGLKHFGFDNTAVKKIQKLAREQEKKLLKDAELLLENQELLLIMSGENTTNAYFKSGNNVEKCNISYHSGTFQDSILITLYEKVDFRYFPDFLSCKIYHWSDDLEQVKIKNEGSENIVFIIDDSTDGDPMLCIEPGETKTIGKDSVQEGLISPDLVNGKSLFSSWNFDLYF